MRIGDDDNIESNILAAGNIDPDDFKTLSEAIVEQGDSLGMNQELKAAAAEVGIPKGLDETESEKSLYRLIWILKYQKYLNVPARQP